jgi:hypothetical protein
MRGLRKTLVHVDDGRIDALMQEAGRRGIPLKLLTPFEPGLHHRYQARFP